MIFWLTGRSCSPVWKRNLWRHKNVWSNLLTIIQERWILRLGIWLWSSYDPTSKCQILVHLIPSLPSIFMVHFKYWSSLQTPTTRRVSHSPYFFIVQFWNHFTSCRKIQVSWWHYRQQKLTTNLSSHLLLFSIQFRITLLLIHGWWYWFNRHIRLVWKLAITLRTRYF